MVNVSLYLTDSSGNTIGLFSASYSVQANTVFVVEWKVPGPAIYRSGKNGPYRFSDLLIYHSADPNQSIALDEAYTTPAYTTQQFEPSLPVFVPIIRR
jgi:hypothetical protein